MTMKRAKLPRVQISNLFRNRTKWGKIEGPIIQNISQLDECVANLELRDVLRANHDQEFCYRYDYI